MNIPNVPKPTAPALLDVVIGQIQDLLKLKLPWLNYSFGRSQKLATTKERKNYFYPGVHIGGGEYISVFPDQSLGNFSFFAIDDPQVVEFAPNSFNTIKAKYALIFWFNLDNIFAGSEDRNTEEIKAQILKVLTRDLRLTVGRLNIESINEKAENIYKGFNLSEINSQFLMQPFAGMRFEGEILIMEGC
jgi:hypothetical protein